MLTRTSFRIQGQCQGPELRVQC